MNNVDPSQKVTVQWNLFYTSGRTLKGFLHTLYKVFAEGYWTVSVELSKDSSYCTEEYFSEQLQKTASKTDNVVKSTGVFEQKKETVKAEMSNGNDLDSQPVIRQREQTNVAEPNPESMPPPSISDKTEPVKNVEQPEAPNVVAKEWGKAISHGQLTNVLEKLYKKKRGGHCKGFSIMGIQAILTGHLDQFDARLKKLGALIEQCCSNPQDLSDQDVQDLFAKMWGDKDWDLLAFLEGVEMLHQGYEYKEVFDPNARIRTQGDINFTKTALSMVASPELEAKGGIIELTDFKTTGIYSESQLMYYFESLENALLEDPSISSPVTLTLASEGHGSAVGYDPGKGWIFIDANVGCSRNGLNSQAIARMVYYVYKHMANLVYEGLGKALDEEICISANFLVLADRDLENLKNKLKKWQLTPGFTDIHEVPKDPIKASDMLYMACLCADLKGVQRMIEKGVDVNRKNSLGKSTMYGAVNSNSPQIMTTLLDAGADPNVELNDGLTVLMAVIGTGKLDLVQSLLDAGADVNRVDNIGWSALYRSMLDKRQDIAELLLAKGASVDVETWGSWTPLFRAIKNGWDDFAKKLITEHGADVNRVSKGGFTPLIIAARDGSKEMVEFLLEKGAKVDVSCVDGEENHTPLSLTQKKGNAEVVAILEEALRKSKL